ncbi:MAG: TIGR03960 family B12-binding radical SAM protein [Candidatus Omnitrophica bacterium]|nr:TIGR03960 family B12-binding radical SAM protein [Candidatus Omnitrophota bacterium]
MIDDILLQVQKPARYIGEEWNVSKKDFDKAQIKFALCFPDLYEVGMSNLGIRILYGILNHIPDVVCERFFACASDLENSLRNRQAQIFSLESKKKLGEFDLVGFSLGYELNYTNVLNILDLGSIPLKSSLRNHTYPLILAGGPAVFNPEPMHEFFDLFVIGEAEEVIIEITDIYRKFKGKFKEGKISKQDLLVIFSGIPGVYVPSLYEVEYNSEGKIEKFSPRISGVPAKIKKRFVENLNGSYFPLDWLVPYIQIIHDRITLEIMRGCPNRCRFCQAKVQYFPLRQRGIKEILDLGCQIYSRTGYEEISLCGLSVSDYYGIEELLTNLLGFFKEKAVSVSLPSIKPKTVVGNLSSLIATIKKTGLTFAPEAASERLRKVLGKDFDVEGFYKAIEQAYTAGYQHIKLYYMIGLPSETQSDLDAIIDFSCSVSELKRKINKVPAEVNISINTLIPKPHTPLQWLRMEDVNSIQSKHAYLKRKMRNKRLKLNMHDPRMSFLEGVFSRGDRKLSQVLLAAFSNGVRFDAWSNYFMPEKWQNAFSTCHIDPNFYLKDKSKDEILPWDFLDTGISKEAQLAEYKEALSCNETQKE